MARKLRLVKTDFTAGELDHLLMAREDIKAYAKGVKRLRDWTQLDSGAIRRRPGSKYLATLLANSILKPFAFGQDQDYVFAFSNTRVDIYTDAGVAATNLTSAPWSTSQLTRLYPAQSADTMILCHPDMPMDRILRTGASTFTRGAFTFEENTAGTVRHQPYYKFADDTVTITPSALSGSITLTASSAVFVAGHDDTIFRWKGKEILITAFTDSTHLTGTVRSTLPGDITAVDTGTEILTVTNHGYDTAQAVVYTSGGSLITGLTSTNTYYVIRVDANSVKLASSAANATAGTAINLTTTGNGTIIGADIDWEEQVFSSVRGYANTAIFHEGRLWFCGTKSLPSHVFGSKLDAYFNFDVGTGLDNESIQVSIRSEQIGEIRGVASNRHLQFFTDQGEFYAPSSDTRPLTPSTFSVRVQTRYGSSYVVPQPFDGATLYAHKGGKSIREFLYRDTEAAYGSNNVSILAAHLINTPVDMAVLYGSDERPEQYAYIVNTDGTLVQFHSIRDEAVAGFALWTTTGLYKSICVVGGKVFVAVQRTLGGVSVRTLEVFEDDRTLDCSFDDDSVSATTDFTGFTHLATDDVQVVSGNLYLGEFTVTAGGEITTDDEVMEITAGLDYTPTFTTLPAASALNDGSLLGEIKRLVKAVMVLDSSVDCVVNDQMLIIRDVTDDLSLDPEPFTGKKEFTLRGYSRDAEFTVEQQVPLSLTVLGFNLEIAV
jgi:hypothetical protein